MNGASPFSPASRPVLGVGMLGYGFMGKAHSAAFLRLPFMMWPAPAVPRLVAICGRDRARVAEARARYGFERYYTDWRDLVEDPEIQVLDNGAPNDLHADPCIAAAERGKHVLCEKPMARDRGESGRMLEGVQRAGVKHMVGFNCRFFPALRLAHELIGAGMLGKIYHFRGRYLKGSSVDPAAPIRWRMRREVAGSGTLGDLGSHTIDLARWLVGEIGAVTGRTRTFIPHRPEGEHGTLQPVTVDDAALALLEFQSGAVGSLEVTRFAPGRLNHHTIEINGSQGSLSFDIERPNELQYFSRDVALDVQGFGEVLVTEARHPYYRFWWPPGHTIGWEHSFIHEVYHFFQVIRDDGEVGPYGASFEDGHRNVVICDAIEKSSDSGRRVYLEYGASDASTGMVSETAR